MKLWKLLSIVSISVIFNSVNAASIAFEATINYASVNAYIRAASSGQLSDVDERSRSVTISKFDHSLGELTGGFLSYSLDTSFHYDFRINGNGSATQLYYQGSTVSAQHSLNYLLSVDGVSLESGSSSSSSGGITHIETGTTYVYSPWSRRQVPVAGWIEYKPYNWISEYSKKDGAINWLNYFNIDYLLSSDGSNGLNLQLNQNSYVTMNCQLYSNSKDCWSSTQGQGNVISSITYQYNEIAAVPVPATVWLFGSGLTGLAGFARRAQDAERL